MKPPLGLSEEIIRFISHKKNEPKWLLDWRLKAYRHWLTMKEPNWEKADLSADRLPGDQVLLHTEAEEEVDG